MTSATLLDASFEDMLLHARIALGDSTASALSITTHAPTSGPPSRDSNLPVVAATTRGRKHLLSPEASPVGATSNVLHPMRRMSPFREPTAPQPAAFSTTGVDVALHLPPPYPLLADRRRRPSPQRERALLSAIHSADRVSDFRDEEGANRSSLRAEVRTSTSDTTHEDVAYGQPYQRPPENLPETKSMEVTTTKGASTGDTRTAIDDLSHRLISEEKNLRVSSASPPQTLPPQQHTVTPSTANPPAAKLLPTPTEADRQHFRNVQLTFVSVPEMPVAPAAAMQRNVSTAAAPSPSITNQEPPLTLSPTKQQAARDDDGRPPRPSTKPTGSAIAGLGSNHTEALLAIEPAELDATQPPSTASRGPIEAPGLQTALITAETLPSTESATQTEQPSERVATTTGPSRAVTSAASVRTAPSLPVVIEDSDGFVFQQSLPASDDRTGGPDASHAAFSGGIVSIDRAAPPAVVPPSVFRRLLAEGEWVPAPPIVREQMNASGIRPAESTQRLPTLHAGRHEFTRRIEDEFPPPPKREKAAPPKRFCCR